jgi:hypothetical protein
MSPMFPCPQCGRDAPIVYRGVVPHCTACGAVRPPLSNPSVNLAGKPSRVGGIVASVVGWIVLVLGGSMALGIELLFAAFGAALLGAAFALPVAIVSLVFGIVLVRRGGSLSRSGLAEERATREQALLELVAHRGSVTAAEAAQTLGVTVAQADAMLTDFAKRDPDRLAVDVDDQGVVRYRVARVGGDVQVRVDDARGWPLDESQAEAEAHESAVPATQAKKKEAGA